jgi:hypothetical protein
MLKRITLTLSLLLLGVLAVAGHDLFVKFDDYFLAPDAPAKLRLMSGTFRVSENAVARNRFRDVSLVTADGTRARPSDDAWRDEKNTATLETKTGAAGTYVFGVSTFPKEITLPGKAFNDYLAHDGLPDTLAARRRDKELGKTARELYSKHPKALYQVGDTRTDAALAPLGYPVELTPLQNPYALKIGDTLELLCAKDGQPVANQFVMAGYEPPRGPVRRFTARADAKGIVRFKLAGVGKWYVKFIHMTRLNEPNLDYESKWASLTFGVR